METLMILGHFSSVSERGRRCRWCRGYRVVGGSQHGLWRGGRPRWLGVGSIWHIGKWAAVRCSFINASSCKRIADMVCRQRRQLGMDHGVSKAMSVCFRGRHDLWSGCAVRETLSDSPLYPVHLLSVTSSPSLIPSFSVCFSLSIVELYLLAKKSRLAVENCRNCKHLILHECGDHGTRSGSLCGQFFYIIIIKDPNGAPDIM